MQAVGRMYRPGQEGQTQIIHINAKDTTDKRIRRTNEIKTGWFKEIFGDDAI
jgi:SNF2 family DNA or RNA helicase